MDVTAASRFGPISMTEKTATVSAQVQNMTAPITEAIFPVMRNTTPQSAACPAVA